MQLRARNNERLSSFPPSTSTSTSTSSAAAAALPSPLSAAAAKPPRTDAPVVAPGDHPRTGDLDAADGGVRGPAEAARGARDRQRRGLCRRGPRRRRRRRGPALPPGRGRRRRRRRGKRRQRRPRPPSVEQRHAAAPAGQGHPGVTQGQARRGGAPREQQRRRPARAPPLASSRPRSRCRAAQVDALERPVGPRHQQRPPVPRPLHASGIATPAPVGLRGRDAQQGLAGLGVERRGAAPLGHQQPPRPPLHRPAPVAEVHDADAVRGSSPAAVPLRRCSLPSRSLLLFSFFFAPPVGVPDSDRRVP